MLNGLDLFSGGGGGAVALSPWVRPIAYCEIDRFAQAVLLSRMASGELPTAPIWDDVCRLRGHMLPAVDIVYGGFPCTDLSDASRGRGKGLEGDQSGLWYEMLRLIEELRPGNVFIENVDGAAAKKWLPQVRLDLWKLGYSSLPLRVRAEDVGAPFKGSRIFVAASDRQGKPAFTVDAKVAELQEPPGLGRVDWGKPPAGALGVDDGIPDGVERRRLLGNAWCIPQARAAFAYLSGLKPLSTIGE